MNDPMKGIAVGLHRELITVGRTIDRLAAHDADPLDKLDELQPTITQLRMIITKLERMGMRL